MFFQLKILKSKVPAKMANLSKKTHLLKQSFFQKKTKMICLSDDSGLEIDILNGKPGIHSSRWGGKDKNFNKAINKVFREIKKKDKDWKKKN